MSFLHKDCAVNFYNCLRPDSGRKLFLRIWHVLEFEEIYRDDADKRMKAGKKIDPTPESGGGLAKGKAVEFMARDAPGKDFT